MIHANARLVRVFCLIVNGKEGTKTGKRSRPAKHLEIGVKGWMDEDMPRSLYRERSWD